MAARLPPLGAIEAFAVAARTGSLTAAATELNLTTSAVSRRVAALEHKVVGAPALRIDNVRPIERGVHAVDDFELRARRLGIFPRVLHAAIHQAILRRVSQGDVHAELTRHQQGGIGHGRVQWLGMPGPGKQEFLALDITQLFLQGLHHGQLLAGMHNGFHVDHGYR